MDIPQRDAKALALATRVLAPILLYLLTIGYARSQGNVPTQFQATYSYLSGQLNSFQSSIDAAWDRSKHPVAWAAQVHGADGYRRQDLLKSDTYNGVLSEIDYLKALGVKAVRIGIPFPILHAGYYANPADVQPYINFYRQLALDVKARGLILIATTGPLTVTGPNGAVIADPYMAGLSMSAYIDGRASMAALIASTMKPDYLTVLNEPDVEAVLSGKSTLATINGSIQLLGRILARLSTVSVPGMKLGAGFGSWIPGYADWARYLCATPIQYLDVHVFPVAGDFLPRLLTLADMASARGKEIAISQAWLFKQGNGETVEFGVVQSRDAFSFWAPLDSAFIQSLVSFAHYKKAAFITPFWARHFRAYLDFNAYGNRSLTEIEAAISAESSDAGKRGIMTTTGAAYAAAIISPPDLLAPTMPTGLTAVASSNSAIALSWNLSGDNVGVLGYQIYRDSALLTTVRPLKPATPMEPYYLDTGLFDRNYTYSVAAFDASGNTSSRSNAVTQRPLDVAPPSLPANVAVTPLSATQARVAWMPSTDNVGVTGYLVHRGSNPGNLTLVAKVFTNEWVDSRVVPATTFYYAVQAFDAAGNMTSLTAPASVTLPADTTPPTVPTGLAAQTISQTQVQLTWSASTDNYYMGGYRIYRGASPGALTLIGGSTTNSYVDNNAKPGSSYYAVASFDAYGNLSAQSAAILVSTPADNTPPSAPATVAAQAETPQRVRVNWSASTDNVRVAYYLIYRGTSQWNLAYGGSTSGAPYVENVEPGRTYYYGVMAVDTAGNYSAMSSVVSATTPSV